MSNYNAWAQTITNRIHELDDVVVTYVVKGGKQPVEATHIPFVKPCLIMFCEFDGVKIHIFSDYFEEVFY